jgi:hypothetical protein
VQAATAAFLHDCHLEVVIAIWIVIHATIVVWCEENSKLDIIVVACKQTAM